MQSSNESKPGQESRNHPEHPNDPGVAACFRLVDLVDGPLRQHEALAGNFVELIEHTGAAGQQARHAAKKTAELCSALGRAFQLAGRSKMPRDPFAHDRLRGAPNVELWIECARHALDY